MKSIEVISDLTYPHCQKKKLSSVFTFEHHWVLQEKKKEKCMMSLLKKKLGINPFCLW